MTDLIDPDATAKALHAANPSLNWLRWEQIHEVTREEYRNNAAQKISTEGSA